MRGGKHITLTSTCCKWTTISIQHNELTIAPLRVVIRSHPACAYFLTMWLTSTRTSTLRSVQQRTWLFPNENTNWLQNCSRTQANTNTYTHQHTNRHAPHIHIFKQTPTRPHRCARFQHTHAHTHTHTFPFPKQQIHTLTYFQTHTHAHAPMQAHTHIAQHKHTHALHTLDHTHRHIYSHIYPHTRTHTHTHTVHMFGSSTLCYDENKTTRLHFKCTHTRLLNNSPLHEIWTIQPSSFKYRYMFAPAPNERHWPTMCTTTHNWNIFSIKSELLQINIWCDKKSSLSHSSFHQIALPGGE